jgi:predicted DNA-binding protein (MmcQ/YjbR family)
VASSRTTRRQVLAFALTLPGAWEDHPWGEDVAKVGAKVFVFLGVEGNPAHLGMTVKLRGEAHQHALSLPDAAPTGYGMGRSGWVTIPFGPSGPGLDVLKEWVEESYRLVAPKRLVAQLGTSPHPG